MVRVWQLQFTCLKLIGHNPLDGPHNVVCAGEDEFFKVRVVGEGYIFSGNAYLPASIQQIMDESVPILRVYHDEEDGDWQFLGRDAPDMKDALIVCLKNG